MQNAQAELTAAQQAVNQKQQQVMQLQMELQYLNYLFYTYCQSA